LDISNYSLDNNVTTIDFDAQDTIISVIQSTNGTYTYANVGTTLTTKFAIDQDITAISINSSVTHFDINGNNIVFNATQATTPITDTVGGGTYDVKDTISALNSTPTAAVLDAATSVEVTDSGSVDVTTLNALDTKTTTIVDASSISTLTGTIANLQTAYDSAGISGLGNEAVIISDTNISATALTTLNTETTGTIDASSVTSINGTIAEVNTLYSSSGISGLGNETVTISDTTNVDVTTLNTLDGHTSGLIDANSISSMTGSITNLNTAYDSAGIDGLGNETLTLTDTANTNAADLIALNGKTTGTINAATVTSLTGTAANANIVLTTGAGEISNIDGNEDVTLTDSTLAVSVLNTLDGNTSGSINASSVTTLTGTIPTLQSVYDSTGITGLGNEALTLSDTTTSATALSTLNAETTGTINASTITTITGTIAEVNTLYAESGISGLGDEAVTISDTANVDVTILNTLDSNTSGTINGSSITSMTGSVANLASVYLGGVSGLGNEALTLTDTANVAANTLIFLDGATSGTIDAATVTSFSGSIANVNSIFASGGISNLDGNEGVTINDTAVTASTLVTLDGHTSGNIDASTITDMTGSATDIQAVYDSAEIINLGGNIDLTITGSGTVDGNSDSGVATNTSGITNVELSSGDDIYNIDFGNLSNLDNVDFAAGDDTISFSTAGSGVLDFSNLDNLEEIDFSGADDSVTFNGFDDESALNVDGGVGTDDFTLNLSNLSVFETDGLGGGAGSDQIIFTGTSSNSTDAASFLGGLAQLTDIETLDITGLNGGTGFSGDDSIEFEITDAMVADWTGNATGTLTLELTSDQAEDIMFTDTVSGTERNTTSSVDPNAQISDSTSYDLGNTTLIIDIQP
jgi:hypothetical protein